MTFKNNKESPKQLSFFLKKLAKKHKLSQKIYSDIDLALGELLGNIIKYNPKKTFFVHLDYSIKADKITFTLTDEGVAFNPLNYKAEALNKSLNKKTIGGWGIRIAKKSMDTISYKRIEDKNQLTLVKIVGRV